MDVLVETCCTILWELLVAFNLSISSSYSLLHPAFVSIPFNEPLLRIIRVNFRVSIPSIPGISFDFKNSCNDMLASEI